MMDANTLIASSAACGFLARIFRPGLDRDLLRRCAADRFAESWPIDGAGADGDAGLALLGPVFDGLDEPALDSIERDNTALFIGPDNPVPMWESVWTTKDRLLFADCTSDVEQAFARAGFVVPGAGREPADHLAHEFSFIAALLARTVAAVEAGNTIQARRQIETAAAFFDQHPARWAADCLRDIEARASTDFYRGAALLGTDAMAALQRLFTVAA
ncbi:MAG: molecular chaperone TorD family protein [Acetobacteraceae bacterium]|nr:molecular chaperone TorD family protein [Acetobacteraceae bacterium]